MIGNPRKAFYLLDMLNRLVVRPATDRLASTINFGLQELQDSATMPIDLKPQKVQFPCEIGKFLLQKLTYAPLGLDACKELIYHYDSRDLRKAQESLNEAIVKNEPDILNKSRIELSEILDRVWNDKTIPRRVKSMKVGIPLSMAAIGSVVAGPIGALGGFLAGIGYRVVDKFIDLETEGLSERLAKLKARSYQVNIYDFKQKYKNGLRI